ncbi:hypothetical protein CBR_g84866 [Chara braunii]|uniref:Ubiquitin-like protease family profile domain-containing protein n=1 Tax=Chara braunii TaxID=69332 RepID=A0A388KB74_CHABU|nr:hypothetical protein CBR_g84866 [Chara braunii]|eukprot:GBG67203.1 hypothetical protein CBR_g84866 [Chara braunii]
MCGGSIRSAIRYVRPLGTMHHVRKGQQKRILGYTVSCQADPSASQPHKELALGKARAEQCGVSLPAIMFTVLENRYQVGSWSWVKDKLPGRERALHMAGDVMRTTLDVAGDVMCTTLGINKYTGVPGLAKDNIVGDVCLCKRRLRDLVRARNYEGTVFLTLWLRRGYSAWRVISCAQFFTWSLRSIWVEQWGINDRNRYPGPDTSCSSYVDQMASDGAGEQRDTARPSVEEVTLDGGRNREGHLVTSGTTATTERSHPSVGGVTPEPCGNRGGAATTTGAAPIADRRRRGCSSGEKKNPQYYKLDNHSWPIATVDVEPMRTQTSETALTGGPDEGAVPRTFVEVMNPDYIPSQPDHPQAYEESEPEIQDGEGAVEKTPNQQGGGAESEAERLKRGTICIREGGGAESEAPVCRGIVEVGGGAKGKAPIPPGQNPEEEVSDEEGGTHDYTQVVSTGDKRVGQGSAEGGKQKKRKIVDNGTKEDKKVWQEKLRYFLPLVMSDDQTWQLGMKFYDEWTKGQLLAPEGALWTKWPLTTDPKATKEGQSFAEDSSGQKRVVYNVRVTDPKLCKGKMRRKQEERDFFVQVNEPDVHCWKEMGDLTDLEKQRILRGVLDLEIVWVQQGSEKLVEHGKMGMKDACEIVKQDRMLLRLWNIIEFQHQGRTSDEWNAGFFRTREQLLTQYGSRGLNEKLWAACRRFVTDHSYLKDCPQYLRCSSDKELKTMLSLVEDKKFPTEFKRAVLSVLKGERSKEKEAPVRLDDCTNIKWRDTKVVTTLSPFAFDAFTAFLVKDDMRRVVRQLRLVAFVPRVWDLSFTSLLHCLPMVSGSAGKWVRRGQIRKTYQIGNSTWAEEDRMYVLFHGDDLKLNTHPVYEGGLRDDDVAALGKKQKCTPSDIVETQFTPTTFHSAGVLHQKGVVYKEMERKPSMLSNLMEFFCPPENAVMFLGKAHTQVVWNLLKSGRHVVVVKGDTKLLSFLKTYIMHEINSGVHNCDLHIGQNSIQHDPNRNFWFKLSSEKRAKLYKFLFQDTRPSYRTDNDYILRQQVTIGTLDGYQGGSREAAANFADKLEECYFDQGKTEVTLNIFRAHFNNEEDFNPNDDEEVSVGNTEFDLEATYRKHAAGVASLSTPASSLIPVGSPLGTSVVVPVATPTSGSSKGFLSSRRRPLSPTVRPGLPIPLPVLSGLLPGKIYHFGKDHKSTSEAEWGHHIVWHPDYFQPAVLDSEWVMSKVNDDDVWEVDTRMSKEDFLQVAHEEVVRRIAGINSLEPENSVAVWHGQSIFKILRDRNSLELLADFYGLETSPSYGIQIEWVISSGGGGTGGGGGGGIGGGGGGGTGSGGGGGTSSGGGGGTVSGGGGNQGMRGAGGDGHTGSGGRGGTRSGGQSGYQPSSARTIPHGMGARLKVEGTASQTSTGSRLVEPTAALLFSGGCIRPTIGAGVFACSKLLSVGSVPCTVSAGSNFASDLEGEVGSIKRLTCGPHNCLHVSSPCVEEKDVTMSEQEEGVVHHPLGDDIARKLFHDDEDLAATAAVVDSSPGKTEDAGKALVELSLNEDVGQQRADSLSPSVEEVVRIVNADLDDLSKFPARVDLIVASGKIKGAGVVLGLKASCVQEEVPRVQDKHEDDTGGHAREEVVTADMSAPSVGRSEGELSNLLDNLVHSCLSPTTIVARLLVENLVVRVRHMDTSLDRGGELNDEVVNFYLALLVRDSHISSSKVYNFVSFFFTKLLLQGCKGVTRWTKDVNLFEYDVLLIPIHKDNEH